MEKKARQAAGRRYGGGGRSIRFTPPPFSHIAQTSTLTYPDQLKLRSTNNFTKNELLVFEIDPQKGEKSSILCITILELIL